MLSDYYYIVEIVNDFDENDYTKISENAFENNSTGSEEFNIDEAKVDEILGERSYSGGDLPISILDEVEQSLISQNYTYTKFYFSQEEDAKRFQDFVTGFPISQVSLVRALVDDWDQKWREHYKRIEICEDLVIVPSWEKSQEIKNELYIYPGMGFGTGNHETTYLCLKAFVSLNEKFKTILDFGCGSGILGLAAFKYNQDSEVTMYDIDESALENCDQNISLNDFEERIGVLPASSLDVIRGKRYDLVFANILLNALIAEKKNILRFCKENTTIILSGLLNGQEKEVIESYKSDNPNIQVLDTTYKGHWVCVTLRL